MPACLAVEGRGRSAGESENARRGLLFLARRRRKRGQPPTPGAPRGTPQGGRNRHRPKESGAIKSEKWHRRRKTQRGCGARSLPPRGQGRAANGTAARGESGSRRRGKGSPRVAASRSIAARRPLRHAGSFGNNLPRLPLTRRRLRRPAGGTKRSVSPLRTAGRALRHVPHAPAFARAPRQTQNIVRNLRIVAKLPTNGGFFQRRNKFPGARTKRPRRHAASRTSAPLHNMEQRLMARIGLLAPHPQCSPDP